MEAGHRMLNGNSDITVFPRSCVPSQSRFFVLALKKNDKVDETLQDSQ